MEEEIFEKYSDSVLKNLDKENMNKIIKLLEFEQCEYIEDLIEDYLDLFTLDYDEFLDKYLRLKRKYNGMFLTLAGEDMNLFEEFFY